MNRINPDISKFHDSKSWAIRNKNIGSYSFIAGSCGTACGLIKTLIKDDSSFSNKTLGLIQSLFFGARGFFQYYLYKQNDDDLGFDKKNRPHAENIGEIACEIETKLNPIFLPVTSLVNENIKDAYSSISHYANAQWWRLRFLSEKIDWKIFDKDFISLIGELKSQDIEREEKASKEIIKKTSPPLGLLGFIFTGLFTPIKAFLKLMGSDNRMINSLTALGQTTQHIVYFFKFTLNELFKAQRNNSINSKLLFGLGIGANVLNIFSPFVELISSENSFINKIQKIYRELASGLTMGFFSFRRYNNGKEWLETYSKDIKDVEVVMVKKGGINEHRRKNENTG